MTTNPRAEAYDAFTASLDPQTRDLVTKLMLHTRTRPDDPQMVGVCLTAIATIKNADAQTRMLEAQQATMRTLEDMKTNPRFAEGLERVSALTRALEALQRATRQGAGFVGIAAGLLGLLWALSLACAGKVGYLMALEHRHTTVHQEVCIDLYARIGIVSRYFRNGLGLPAAADRIAQTYLPDCPR